jgi:RNA polymerase sigma-70 factor, ECF subfamily
LENKALFFSEFEKFHPQLKSFILRMTASVEDTEDLLHDVFIKASENISTFESKSSLKTWVFSIAANHTKNFLRSKKRWTDNVTDIGKEAALSSPNFMQRIGEVSQNSTHGAFVLQEHINFCFTCIGKTLPIEQQIVILLKEIYGFKVSEISEITGETKGGVKHTLSNGRQTMISIFEKRCSLVNKKGICHQCSELNGIFNPHHETQKELMKIDMVKKANKRSQDVLFDLRTKIVKAIDPYDTEGADLQFFHIRHTKKAMEDFFDKK